MNKKRNDYKQKAIIGLLGVVSVCLIAIVALLAVNMFGKSGNLAKGSDAGQEEVAKTEATAEPEETDWPYYKYEGELFKEPLTGDEVTEIENDYILEYFSTEEIQNEYRDAILSLAKEYADQYGGVWGQPTIIKGCEPCGKTDKIFVDIHYTPDDRLIEFWKDADDEPVSNNVIHLKTSQTKDYSHRPELSDDGKYFLDASRIYTGCVNQLGLTEEEEKIYERKLLKCAEENFKKAGVTEEQWENVEFLSTERGFIFYNEDGTPHKMLDYILARVKGTSLVYAMNVFCDESTKFACEEGKNFSVGDIYVFDYTE